MSPIITKADYVPADLTAAQALCLYVATRLGTLRDDIVVVGGLVPSLLVGEPPAATGAERHVGTKDVDLGLALRLLDGRKYAEVAKQLREGGFERDKNESGNPTNPRWVLQGTSGVTLDFLIAPADAGRRGGDIHNLEGDFAAYVTPGLDLAFEDRRLVSIDGTTSMHERAARTIYVCEAGAYVVLKALAVEGRGKEKDAYDLDWLLQAYPGGIAAVASRMRSLRECDAKRQALEVLKKEFQSMDAIGPVRAARFLGREAEDRARADVHSRVQELLRLLAAA